MKSYGLGAMPTDPKALGGESLWDCILYAREMIALIVFAELRYKMSSLVVVVMQPFIQIDLQFLDGLVDFLRNVIWIELLQYRFV